MKRLMIILAVYLFLSTYSDSQTVLVVEKIVLVIEVADIAVSYQKKQNKARKKWRTTSWPEVALKRLAIMINIISLTLVPISLIALVIILTH